MSGVWSDNLRSRLGQARRDLDLVIQLDNIRLSRVTRGELVFYKAQAARKYEEAFRQAELGKVYDQAQRVAAVVNASAVRWRRGCSGRLGYVRQRHALRRWLLEVARSADSDPEGWRTRILDPRHGKILKNWQQ